MAQVAFYRGKEQKYLDAIESGSHKYDNGIYFAQDTGVIWLDGSAYGVTDVPALDYAITSVQYDSSTGSVTFSPKDPNKASTVLWLPKVEGNPGIAVTSTYGGNDQRTFKIGLNIDPDYRNSLKIGENGLKLGLNLKYANKSISIEDDQGNKIGNSISAADFIKDGMLESAEYVAIGSVNDQGLAAGKYLKLTFVVGNYEDGELVAIERNDVYVNLNELSAYRSGKGIVIDEEGKINVSLASNAETNKYLTVNDGSLAIHGIDKAIDDQSTYFSGELEKQKAAIDDYTINDISVSLSPTLHTGNIQVDYRDSIRGAIDGYVYDIQDGSNYGSGNIVQGDTLSQAFIKLQNKLQDFDGDLGDLLKIKNELREVESAIGAVIGTDGRYVPRTDSSFINGLGSVSEEIQRLDSVLGSFLAGANLSDENTGQVIVRVTQVEGVVSVEKKDVGELPIGTMSNESGVIDSSTSVGNAFGTINDSILWFE